MLGEHVDYRRLDLRRENGHARHLEAEQTANRVERSLGVVVGVEHQRVHFVRESLILEGSRDLGKERIADVGDDQAKQRARAAGKIARGLVLRVAEFADGGENAIASSRPCVTCSVEDVGNGRRGHGGLSGHIFYTHSQFFSED